MCGIYGVVCTPSERFPADSLQALFGRLARLSESRGREAAGVAILRGDALHVLKQPTSSRRMLRSRAFRDLFRTAVGERARGAGPVAICGHSRLVTNGSQALPENNQPVVADGLVGFHNGIVVNHRALEREIPGLERRFDVDTEVLLRLIRHFERAGASAVEALRRTFARIEGVANVALLYDDHPQLLLATNNGSLYVAEDRASGLLVFASEAYVVRTAIARERLGGDEGGLAVVQLAPGHASWIDLERPALRPFALALDAPAPPDPKPREMPCRIVERSEPGTPPAVASLAPETREEPPPAWFTEAFERDAEAIRRLRRCRRCVLPETVPFVDLDEDGVCGACRHWVAPTLRGHDALEALVAPHRRSDGGPECVVPLSGGRDSCWALHYVVEELGLRPIAYTYDWGMVTDLARRNCSRLCGRLGVEHVIVSADLARKRANIRKNVTAWLRRPHLGTIPLFMAGDKQFFYYANRLLRQTGTELLVFSMNPMERTDFKHGFCGVSGGGHGEHFFRLSPSKNVQLAAFYAKEALLNPRYLNASLLDTLFAWFVYFVMPHEYEMLYDFVEWDEQTIERTLLGTYDWETARDTSSTWRIGDGTAAFYNHIYHAVAGFSENDTFRSEQVRRGALSRDEALALVERDNRPRYDSLRWYCDVVGIDFEHAMRTIDAMPRLYA